jgi:single-strand DNA-binding protein
MVGSVNKVILLGNLGRDPEIRSMQSGKKMASFSIATSKRWKDKNTQEQKENTSWHNIVVFNEGLVDVIEKYVKKGSKIYVEGELSTRKYQDKDGNDRYTTEVVLQGYNSNLTMLGSANSMPSSGNQPLENSNDFQETDNSINSDTTDSSTTDDDIPF